MDGVAVIAGALRLSDGRIVVADGGEHRLVFYSPQGEILFAVGRYGRGPGEFDRLWDMKRIKDTTVAYDQRGVAQVYAPDGAYVRTLERPAPTVGQRVGRVGFLASGEMVAYEALPLDGSETLRRMTLFAFRPNRERSPLGVLPLRKVARLGAGIELVAFGPEATAAVTSRYVCVGWTHSPEIQCRTLSGPWVTMSLTVQTPGSAVSDGDKEVYFHGIDLANPGPRGAEFRQRVRATTVFSEEMPVVGRLLGALTDEIWVGPPLAEDFAGGWRHPVSPDSTRWEVLRIDGELRAEVMLPPMFRLLEAGGGYILGVRKNLDESEDLVLYSLSRASRN